MKRIIAVWSLCMLAALASFGALLLEDRALGLPLPYSLPLAFGATAVLGPLLLMAAAKLRPQRVVVRSPAMVTVSPLPAATEASRVQAVVAPAVAAAPLWRGTPSARGRRARAAEGVILFDMASVEAARVHAA